ncbi:aspartyl protease family protein 1 isoform X2 [Physcomitrium patens]|uniref:aspartyl protease family protein 1 isoform X2 n=1 Tax=Physcomitrium patens TaxID=3218 RepID=UPI000D160033|nr:aspartyl protease family protein 1-like isoform X2 [Physcomitrium patens]XP_024360628.1 aspartyl protease family protein 1-like isoform X2 [Physcomitrium patens]|eukprot:XP_024360626.1 aspartyl protease family protein 1-like isoform X2 [Physcomitrella patens]
MNFTGRFPNTSRHRTLAWWLLLLAAKSVDIVRGSLYSFEVTHRYSEKARKELQERHGQAFQDWPQQGSPEFHDMLFFFDLRRHLGRIAASKTPPLMASSTGNTTYYNQYDGLQYTYIEIGTPSQAYFVALDTGSDLLWLPCAHCVSCVASVSTEFSSTYNVYDPAVSTTYKGVGCGSPYCDMARQCALGSTQCPYHLQYLSPASSEGYLVDDVIYLTPQNGGDKIAIAIVFGCGTNQTGAFLNGSTVPNGLLGLGMRGISTPSILARAQVVANSFSMCFDYDVGTGRLVFGDRGSPHAESTPILTRLSPPYYWVSLTYVVVGGKHVLTPAVAIFDTGTTYTYLTTTYYNKVAAAFSPMPVQVDRAVPYQRMVSPVDAFDLCYALDIDKTSVELPAIALHFSGGAKLEVIRPYVLIGDSQTISWSITASLLIV